MKVKERSKARMLREKGLSLNEIALKVGCCKSSISYWVRDIKLTSSQRKKLDRGGQRLLGSQRNQEKYRALRRNYQEEGRILLKTNNNLFIAGIMLFWAEGHRKRNSVTITNSDSDLLGFFLLFLKKCFKVESKDISFSIHWHEQNGDYHKIQRYWEKKLSLPSSCFKKDWTDVRKRKSSDLKVGKHPFGIGRLYIHDTRIVQMIYGAIQEFAGIDKPDWLNLRRG